MNNLPQKIKLTIHGEEIDFSLTDRREIKYYGKTETSNESLWRTDKLEDNEVLYQTEWGWGVFVKVEERELTFEERWELSKKYGFIKSDCEIPSPDSVYMGINERETMIGIWNDPIVNSNIPTKLITLTYKENKIESYE